MIESDNEARCFPLRALRVAAREEEEEEVVGIEVGVERFWRRV